MIVLKKYRYLWASISASHIVSYSLRKKNSTGLLNKLATKTFRFLPPENSSLLQMGRKIRGNLIIIETQIHGNGQIFHVTVISGKWFDVLKCVDVFDELRKRFAFICEKNNYVRPISLWYVWHNLWRLIIPGDSLVTISNSCFWIITTII